jgi:hypothetical protein
MGFWNRLFGRTAKTGDAFFGEMTYMEVSNDPAQSYFECARYFKPIDRVVELGVTGQMSGPTQRQKAFFTQLENDYPLIAAAVVPIIENEFRNWKPEFKIGNFGQEFKLTWLAIPICDQQPVEWELAFETVHDLNHTLFITMQDYKPIHILIDG